MARLPLRHQHHCPTCGDYVRCCGHACVVPNDAPADTLPVGQPRQCESCDRVLVFSYTNYRGVTSTRRATPKHLRFGVSPDHKEPTWLLECWDHDRQALRTFELAKMIFKEVT